MRNAEPSAEVERPKLLVEFPPIYFATNRIRNTMLISLLCFDKPDHVAKREQLRPAHLEWIEKTGVRLTFAGPMLSPDAKTAHGSIIVGEFASLEDAQHFSEADPYRIGGLFERVVIQRTRQVYPTSLNSP
jgi:uncharacterized protein